MKQKHKNHKDLIDDYFSINKHGRKMDMVAMLMQVSVITVLFSWKPAQIEHYKIAAPILLSISLYFFFKDFLAFLKIDKLNNSSPTSRGVH